jgi:hypothetical protein
MYNIKCKFTAHKYKFQIGFVKTFAARQNKSKNTWATLTLQQQVCCSWLTEMSPKEPRQAKL